MTSRGRQHLRSESGPLAVTMGEPAGVGGELTLKCWLRRESEHLSPFFAVDSPARLDSLRRGLGLEVPIRQIESTAEVPHVFRDALPVMPIQISVDVTPGQPDSSNSGAVVRSIDDAVATVRRKEAVAVVTNPIHKSTLSRAEFPYPGHTEYLGVLAEVSKPVMMLVSDELRVVPVTGHMALRDAVMALTPNAIVEAAKVSNDALVTHFGIDRPRLVVASLNPHAGENDLFGEEERTIIRPAIELLQADGLDVRGPLPADSLFHAGARTTYDAAICMYHDQALIPLKAIDFMGGVNVTLGLPFVRTSPDHGTALDIAGQGTADETSMLNALKLAARMARRVVTHEGLFLSAHG
ncbi:MAG: 4-hydroxythreonine-4-phosphate dehydrogenase PdxA [Rhodospirillaceae bacterium]|nr:4-hydroxythreonine-4-phosphate dehydrogenase PdxA [Rhodospirillaceae bacterium]